MSRRSVAALFLAALYSHAPGVAAEAAEELALAGADDECSDGVCSLSALQLRASARGAAKDEAAEAVDEAQASGSRRRHAEWARVEFGKPSEAAAAPGGGRRRRLVLWKATPEVDGDQQPETCGNHTIQKGYEGCCAGQLYEFANMGCCGSLLYRTDELACCRHRNRTATIYNSLTTNCCDDPLKENKERGVICHMKAGQSSCCHIAESHLRRRRHFHRKAASPDLEEDVTSNGDDMDDDDDEDGEDDGPEDGEDQGDDAAEEPSEEDN